MGLAGPVGGGALWLFSVSVCPEGWGAGGYSVIYESLVKLSGLVKSVTKMVTGCLRMTKVAIFVV